jgi:hypothetical protein
MDKGDFSSDLSARVDAKSALAMQKTNATLADNAMAGSRAIDSQGDRASASVYVEMAGGDFDTLQKSKAGADASVYQKTNATQALYGSAATKAVNREGDRANTSVNAIMNSGRFNNTLGLASKDQNVSIYHKTDATQALSASSDALAEDSDGNKAKSDVSATMAGGQFNTVMNLEADGSATIYQQTNSTQALTGSAVSRAVNSDGDRANTSVTTSMNSGRFNNTLGVAASDENVSIYHEAEASKALAGTSGAFAEDQSGNLASTSVNTAMANGLFDTIMRLEADGSAAIWQKTNATQAISGQALTLGLSKEGDRASTGVSATMDQGYFNNTLLVQAHDDSVSDYHKFNATEVLTANKNGLVQDGLGNKSSVAAALRMDRGQFDGAMDLYVDQGAEISQYLKAEKVLWGTDSAHSEDASSHRADSSLTVTNGMFSNEILARALGNATIYHDFYAYADLIRANVSAWQPGEESRINTTVSVNRNNVMPARLQGLQTADSNSTGTEANQYIQARGKINSEVRSHYSPRKNNESDLNYDSVGVDSHLWAATDALGAYSDRWTTFYLDHDVGNETIQSSVDEAFDHPTTDRPTKFDTIRVFEGVYRENVKVDKSLYIIGNGSDKTIVDGEDRGRVFEVGTINPGKIVTLADMKIWNGTAPLDLLGNAYGGGIYSNAILTLYGVNVTRNQAIGKSKNGTGGEARGGGIYNTGNLTQINSTVNRNLALGGNGFGLDATGASGSNDTSGGGASNVVMANTTFSASGQGSKETTLTLDSGNDGNYLGSYLAGQVYHWILTYNSGVSDKLKVDPNGVQYIVNGNVQSLYDAFNQSGYDAGNTSGTYWGINYTALVDSKKKINLSVSSTISGGSDGSGATSSGDGGKDKTAGTGIGGNAYGGGIYSEGEVLSISSIIEKNLALGGNGYGGDGIGGLGGNGGSGGSGSNGK